MTNNEIREAIENNPGGTDLEIALAIGSDEVSVARVRAAMLKEKAKEDELKRIERENADKAAALAKEKTDAAAAKEKADHKEDPGHSPKGPTTPPPSSEPIPGHIAPGAPPTVRKIYFRQPSGASVELDTAEEHENCIILELKP